MSTFGPGIRLPPEDEPEPKFNQDDPAGGPYQIPVPSLSCSMKAYPPRIPTPRNGVSAPAPKTRRSERSCTVPLTRILPEQDKDHRCSARGFGDRKDHAQNEQPGKGGRVLPYSGAEITVGGDREPYEPEYRHQAGREPGKEAQENANGISRFIGAEFSCGSAPARDCSIAALRFSSVISSLGILKVPSTTTAGIS